jgi:phenylalanyl-tRNA synthetase beta chain
LYDLRHLVAARGFAEVYNYSFLSEETARQFSMDPSAHVAVANPIAADQGLMRTSLIPGIWKNVVENSKYANEFRIFEIGHEIHGTATGLPREVTHLAAAVYRSNGDAAGLFELKKLAECVAPRVEVRPTEPCPFEHPARVGELTLKGTVVGRLFEFHPALVRGRGSVLDIDLDALAGMSQEERRYQPVQRFPSSAFDLSVISPERALVGDIQKELAQLAGEGLEDIVFVRQYSGPPLPVGTKSVSFRLIVAAPGRTLSSDEIGARRTAIIDGMRERGYELRV